MGAIQILERNENVISAAVGISIAVVIVIVLVIVQPVAVVIVVAVIVPQSKELSFIHSFQIFI